MNTLTIQEMITLLRSVLPKFDLPPALIEFTLDEHERDVMRSFVCFVEDPSATVLSHEYRPDTKGAIRILENLADTARTHYMTVKWALLLHDVTRGRSIPGPHPETAAALFRKLAEDLRREAGWSKQDVEGIAWLIRYHDVLGNVYTGERTPEFVSHILPASGFGESLALGLLQLVTVCDMFGTERGHYLTNEKVYYYWERLGSGTAIEELSGRFWEERLLRWTGDGTKDGKGFKLRSSSEPVWNSRIAYIQYGFYLFLALHTKELLQPALEMIANIVNDLEDEEGRVVLVFDKYNTNIESTRKVLDMYEECIRQKLLPYTPRPSFGWAPITIDFSCRSPASDRSLEQTETLEFPGGSLGRYPGPSGGKIMVPLSGSLPDVPKLDDAWEIRYAWVAGRKQNVAYGYKLDLWGFDDAEDFYCGPYNTGGEFKAIDWGEGVSDNGMQPTPQSGAADG